MMRRGIVLAAVFVALALGGCSKNDVRLFKLYTFQIEDDAKKRPRKQTATAPANDEAETEKKAVAASSGDGGSSAIETGSTSSDACQGEHLAYQATKEYLKNFGPKPPDEPGDKGPCRADTPPAQ